MSGPVAFYVRVLTGSAAVEGWVIVGAGTDIGGVEGVECWRESGEV